VTLDASGNYALSTGEVDNGSIDNCGIGGLSLNVSTFSCADLGANTVVFNVWDIYGNTSACTATVTVEGIVPNITITESLLPDFCQGGVIVLTANSPEAVSYFWDTDPGQGSQSIQVTADGVYTVTVTSASGCTATLSHTVVGFDPGALLSEYSILATKEVHLHGNNEVVSGGVGVNGARRKAKIHKHTTVNTFVKASRVEINGGSTVASVIVAPAGVSLPTFHANPYNSNNHVPVGQNQNVVLTDCVYGKLDIKKNATVTFTCDNIFIHELKMKEGVTINFSGSTNMFINKKVKIEKNSSFNPDGEHVTVYVDEKFEVKENSDVTAHVYATGDLKARSKDDLSISMTGSFFGKKVEGKEGVSWNWDTHCDPAPLPALPAACDDCHGGATQMDLIYNGADSAFVEITGDNGSPVYFSGYMDPGETIITVGDGPNDEFDDHMEVYVNGVEETRLHNHGSVNFGPGTVIGDLTITYMECKDSDDPICPVALSRIAAEEKADAPLISEIKAEAYPNPFVSSVMIDFSIPEDGITRIELISLTGEIIESADLGLLEARMAHQHEYVVHDHLPAGTYLYRIISGKYVATGKLLYMK